jgi:GTP-binding protein
MDCSYSIVNISSAIFKCSAPDLDSCPDESLPEFAFVGRSNVGKSSLLNMLAGKEALARVSPTPGFTKLINIFTINQCWRLVDLPGYGFAHVARQDSARFNQAVLNYLEHRTNLCSVFALIESGLSPQAIDLEFVEWLTTNTIPFVLVFTKSDRVPPATARKNIAAFMDRISAWFQTPPAIFTCSARSGRGRKELLAVIDEAMNVIKAEQAHAIVSEAAAAPRSKPRPDRHRPW